jgi:prepilin-type N-terminal cleavage/methylation domain-containing protein
VRKLNSKGFTLIELLVVIAIIGILSTIAMTSLNGARLKAKDASFKSAASSLLGTAVTCCDTTGANLNTSAVNGTGPVCNVATVSGNYPGNLGAVDPGAGCNSPSTGQFTLTIAADPANIGNCTGAVCDETKCTFHGTGGAAC